MSDPLASTYPTMKGDGPEIDTGNLSRDQIKEIRLSKLEERCKARGLSDDKIAEYKERLSDQIDKAPSVAGMRKNLVIDSYNDVQRLEATEPTLDEIAEQDALDRVYPTMGKHDSRNDW